MQTTERFHTGSEFSPLVFTLARARAQKYTHHSGLVTISSSLLATTALASSFVRSTYSLWIPCTGVLLAGDLASQASVSLLPGSLDRTYRFTVDTGVDTRTASDVEYVLARDYALPQVRVTAACRGVTRNCVWECQHSNTHSLRFGALIQYYSE